MNNAVIPHYFMGFSHSEVETPPIPTSTCSLACSVSFVTAPTLVPIMAGPHLVGVRVVSPTPHVDVSPNSDM